MTAKAGHSERVHAVLSPSGADRWFTCTGSVDQYEKFKIVSTSGPAAQEGTAAHEFLEAAWTIQKDPTNKHWLGKKFNDKWPVTSEMAQAVQVCYDLMVGFELDGWTVYSEHKNAIVCTGEGGTLDFCAVHPKKRRMVVVDYKHGRGVSVDADESKQMRLYALGMIDFLDLRGTLDELELIISQPRSSEAPKRWMDNMVELYKFEREVVKKAKIIHSGKGVLVPGEKQCKWCDVGKRGLCSAFNEEGARRANLDFADITQDVQPIDKKKASKIFSGLMASELDILADNRDFIQMWLNVMDSAIFDAAFKGKLKKYKVVQGDANRKWTDPEKVKILLAKMGFEENEYAPRSLNGLGAVTGLFKTKKDGEKFISKNTIRPKGKPVLTVMSDKRPTINPSDDFIGITKEEE